MMECFSGLKISCLGKSFLVFLGLACDEGLGIV